MKKERLNRWLHNIYHTRDEEISCSECFRLVSHFVEVELSGEDPAARLPHVQHHIDQCQVCREEYETLRDLQRFENEGGSLSVDDFKDLIP